MVRIVEPKVEIISELDGSKILKRIERAARTCYKSEGLITEDDTSARKMIQKLIEMGHTAMLEFADIHVLYTADTGFLKDITRMRLCSFAAESTRWCSYNKDKFGREISVIRPVHIKEGTPEYEIWLKANEEMEKYYMAMADIGCKPDQLRMLLNHSVKTEINIKTNIREWRHILNLRCDKPVHPSIRHLMLQTLEIFHNKIPVLFDDIFDKYKTDIEEFKNL